MKNFSIAHIVIISLLFVLIFLFAGWGWLRYFINQPIVEHGQRFVVPHGASTQTVAGLLRRQLPKFSMPFVWVLYGKIRGWSRAIKAGEYYIIQGNSRKTIWKILIFGKVIQHRVTLISGMTIEDVLIVLTHQPELKNDIQNLGNGFLLARYLEIDQHNLEGLFLPETYFYGARNTVSSILKRAYTELHDVLSQAWKERATGLPYKTAYEALIMASLIQTETGVAEERAKIAGVFVRRLQKGMRLQSDSTVIYGMGKKFKGRLTKKNLQEQTPYNTYCIYGLPPTPVALVTRDDITAALHPEKGNALYFVAKGDGTHVFSDTLKEQQKAIARYQLKRRVGYHSSPPVLFKHEKNE